MKKGNLISFMRGIAEELKENGSLGTAHVYRSSLNAILTFHGSEKLTFRQLTPDWLKRFEGSLRHAGCAGMVRPHVPAPRTAVCRFCLSVQK